MVVPLWSLLVWGWRGQVRREIANWFYCVPSFNIKSGNGSTVCRYRFQSRYQTLPYLHEFRGAPLRSLPYSPFLLLNRVGI